MCVSDVCDPISPPRGLLKSSDSDSDPGVFQEDAEAARLKEQRLAEYAAKKAKSRFSQSQCSVLGSANHRAAPDLLPTLYDDQPITIFRLTPDGRLVYLRVSASCCLGCFLVSMVTESLPQNPPSSPSPRSCWT